METSIDLKMVPTPEYSAISSKSMRILRPATREFAEDKVQTDYLKARSDLFDPNIPLTQTLIHDVLEKRLSEINQSISSSSLKGATDRDGFPLASLKELTEMAIQELDGKLNAKSVLKKQLQMITDEEDQLVRISARNHVSELPQIDKRTGAIFITSFTDENRQSASEEARKMVEQFTIGKDRLQQYVNNLNDSSQLPK